MAFLTCGPECLMRLLFTQTIHARALRIKELMSDDEYKGLQETVVNRPDMGVIIQGTGGLRKFAGSLKARVKVVVLERFTTG